ncbi:MAG: gliding motility protein GldN [Dysgonamonadaceae bacterium]|jgi:gliding motility associated protien GldN|nr:gliding motility protein GldN [Dysgonamonadaceae bacterium]
MKPFYFISLLLMLFAVAYDAFAQQETPPQRRTRQRPGEVAATDNSPKLTERAKIKNEENSKGPSRVVWLREMYRTIDLDKENNAALYFPVEPLGDRVNLFTLIFRLLADGKITAYNYLISGDEAFVDKEKLDFEKDVLKKYEILYTKQGSGENARFVVDDGDVPSAEVKQYMIKEGWYFDEATGKFDSQITAICPIMKREDYGTGNVTQNGLFWLPYDAVRPYLSQTLIMTSDLNNAVTYSIDDYFTKRMYQGDIIKTVNLRNRTLQQQVGSDDPKALKLAQDSIERQLQAFRQQLWMPEDSTLVASNSKKAKKSDASKDEKKEEKQKQEKPKASKPEKSSSTPTRSVRRTR